MPLEKSALTGMTAGVSFQQAPGEVTPAVPGDCCLQCGGDLIRLEGKLSCGNCGLAADADKAKRFQQTIGLHSLNADLLEKQRAMEAELAALRTENAVLRKDRGTAEMPAESRKHKR